MRPAALPDRFMRKIAFLLVAWLTCLPGFQPTKSPKFAMTPEIQAALDGIRADSLRGDLSFIASDLLEGRNTPSRGLDIAAEYIAAQFRRAGLEPGGDDGYFQTARMAVLEPDLTGFVLHFSHGRRDLAAGAGDVVINTSAALDLDKVPIFKLDPSDESPVERFTAAEVNGKAVLIEFRRNEQRNYRAAMRRLRDATPVVIISVDTTGATERSPQGRLVDPDEPVRGAPRITLLSPEAASFYASLRAGLTDAGATIHVAAPRQTTARLHNVIGILRGSDPQLKDTCELLTAHYDHLGEKPDGEGDRIFNGANDDGSGTVSVMEVARALSRLPQHPRRSIVFMTFFGEEKGLFGSRYYAHHPTWPLEKIVAQLNLEQVGRTDSTEGPQISNATLTGFSFSNLTDFVGEAGKLTGIKIYNNPRNSDAYFSASDNLSLAEAGVPAQTLCVAFDYSDYHAVGDEWQKINYDNMAKVDRAVALAVLLVADSDQPPHWNADNPKAAGYLKAWRERHK
jgi:hypothetical protein